MYPWEGAWIDDGEACPYFGDMDFMEIGWYCLRAQKLESKA